MDEFVAALKKYATFGGRARRREYWFFVLFYLLIALVLGMLDALFVDPQASGGMGPLGAVFALAMLLPSIAVTVRRLHDTDRSGWWVAIGLVPLVGAIVLLVFCVQRGTAGPNRYGDDPLAAPALGFDAA